MPNPMSSCKPADIATAPMDNVLTHLYIARSWLTPMHREKELPETRIKAALAEVNAAIETCHQVHIIECQKLREG